MRILLVSHLYPPRHHAGVERYTAALGKALRARGHAVEVFTTTKDISRTDMEVASRVEDGIAVHELTNNLLHESFEQTYSHPVIEARFQEVLERARPDLVHFQHLLYLSLGCARIAAARGIPAFLTLHDFWLQCARFGQRIRIDGEVCHAVEAPVCARCIAMMKYAQSPMQRSAARVIAGVRRWSGLNLGRLAIALGRLAEGRGGDPQEPAQERVAQTLALLRERDRAIQEELIPAIHRFISPSRFLLEEMRRWGLPAGKLEHLRVGIDTGDLAGFRRSPAEALRVAFAGTVVPHKGAHVLLDAWERIADRRGAQLTLHGSLEHRPDYVAAIRRRAAALGVRVAGEFPPGDVARVLGETDLLVVPSIWYENSPLIIAEALATGTPLLVSDLGGMRELVEEGVSGYRFAPGDAGDLAARIERLLNDRSALERLYPDGPIALRTIEEDARDLEERYVEAIEEVRG